MDRETNKSFTFRIATYGPNLREMLKRLESVANVGDFVVIEGETYRRVVGGFKVATEEDMAELISSRLSQ